MAYQTTSPLHVAPFQYTQLFWGTIIGYCAWQETPDLHTLIGATLVIAAGGFLMHRQGRPGRRRLPE